MEARKATDQVCRMVEAACLGSVDGGFAAVRPPGHHAGSAVAGGFCILNSVALAASYARAQFPSVKRVLIVDWDVHHGDGTQSIFWDDPAVLFFDVHRQFHGGSGGAGGGRRLLDPRAGRPAVVGGAAAAGRTVNVGWSRSGAGDAEYRAVWSLLLLPIAQEFDPDLVLVSAGFDAAEGDPLCGGCRVTPREFAEMTRRLKRALLVAAAVNRSGRPAPVVCALEGGYARGTLGECVVAVVEELLRREDRADGDDEDTEKVLEEEEQEEVLDGIHPSAARDIRQTIEAQRPFWRCLGGGSSSLPN